MKSMKIKLDSIDKVKRFVNAVNKFDGDIDLVSDRFVVDAKSIMGIFSLDLSGSITLNAHNGAEFDKLSAELREFAS